MKKTLLAILIAGLAITGLSGLAQAVTIDTLLYETKLADSSKSTELEWVNGLLGGGFTFLYKDENLSGEWTNEGEGRIYSHALVNSPAYFLIKTGQVTDDKNTHFLFQNIGELNLAVINLSAMGFNTISNITGVSHISEFGGSTPVPEPATMLLFGAGMAGLVGVARQRKNKTIL